LGKEKADKTGQVTTVKNSEGTIEYQYNRQGYLVSVTNVNGDVVSYAYDEYGNKTSMTYPDGRAVRY
jgi:YD repeat-containing protein